MRTGFHIAVILLLSLLLWGCSGPEKEYIIPLSYSSQGTMKVYTDKSENEYDINVNKTSDGNFSLDVTRDGISWHLLTDGSSCTLSNSKFPDSSVSIGNFKLMDTLTSDFDLGGFINEGEASGPELTRRDGMFTRVLTFNKKNYLPEKITVYKNDFLVKTIVYNNIEIE